MRPGRWYDSDPRILRILAFGVLIAGVATCVLVRPVGANGDDFVTLYALARGVLTGTNVYDRTSLPADFPDMLYPPATAFPFLPFALLPYAFAKPAFLLVMLSTLVIGLRALVRLVAPGKGSHVWMGITGIILLSSGIRWGMMLLQMAPLLLGLMCLLIVALHTERPRGVVALATLATLMKVTLALPFLGLLVLHRRFKAVAIAGGTWAVFTVLGFLRLGPESLASYRLNVAGVQSVDDPTNINMPDPWRAVSLPRLDWAYLFYGITGNLKISQVLTYLLCGLVGAILLREMLRARDTRSVASTAGFLTPMLCLGSLAVYHHHYDLCLFFAPAVLLLFDKSLRQPKWAFALLVPLLLIICILPVGAAQSLMTMVDAARGAAYVKLSFVVAVTLALIGSLAALRERQATAA